MPGGISELDVVRCVQSKLSDEIEKALKYFMAHAPKMRRDGIAV